MTPEDKIHASKTLLELFTQLYDGKHLRNGVTDDELIKLEAETAWFPALASAPGVGGEAQACLSINGQMFCISVQPIP